MEKGKAEVLHLFIQNTDGKLHDIYISLSIFKIHLEHYFSHTHRVFLSL